MPTEYYYLNVTLSGLFSYCSVLKAMNPAIPYAECWSFMVNRGQQIYCVNPIRCVDYTTAATYQQTVFNYSYLSTEHLMKVYAFSGGDFDMRQLGSGPRGPPMSQGNDQDMRLPPPGMSVPPSGPPVPPVPPPLENYGAPPLSDFENRYRKWQCLTLFVLWYCV